MFDTLCFGNVLSNLRTDWPRVRRSRGASGGCSKSTCQRAESSYSFGKVILCIEPAGSVEIWCWKVGERSELTAALGFRNWNSGWELVLGTSVGTEGMESLRSRS